MRRFSSLALIVFLSLAVVSCRSVIDPTFVPAGYTYHGDEYKAPPGPRAASLGYEYSAAKNAETLAIWRIAVADLLDQLEDQSGLSPQSIYVHQQLANNAFNTSYDHIIRDELRARGYTLETTIAAAALQLWYEAHIPVDATAPPAVKPVYNGDQVAGYNKESSKPAALNPQEDYVLILNLARGDTLFGKAAGVYKLPSYGYEPLNPLASALTQGGAAP